MNIKGKYKVSIEMTARKVVKGLIGTIGSLLSHLGTNIPEPSDIEEQVHVVIKNFRAAEDVFESFEMTISDGTVIVQTNDGEMIYTIEHIQKKDENRFLLDLHSGDIGTLQWEIYLLGNYLLIDSIDGLSEYVFERNCPPLPPI